MSPSRPLAISADVFCCPNLEGGECYWRLAKVTTKHLTRHRALLPHPHKRIIQNKMSIVPRLRNHEIQNTSLSLYISLTSLSTTPWGGFPHHVTLKLRMILFQLTIF